MKTDPSKEAPLIINSIGIGTVTRKMVRERATELALINGRSVQDVSVADWEQAKRELTGEPETDPKETLLEAAPESERWDPLPGSTGHIIPVASIDGEGDDGRSVGEKLIDEGIQEAEHDQMLQAARANKKGISAKIELGMNPSSFRSNWERGSSFIFKGHASHGVLRALIREDESTVGYDRNDVRAKAKSWLIEHGAMLEAEDIVLARDHFGYLLPTGWGS